MDADNNPSWRPPFLREMEVGLRGFSGETQYLKEAETAWSLIKTTRRSFEDYSLGKDALEEPWKLLCRACDLMVTAVQATCLGFFFLNRGSPGWREQEPAPIKLHESFAHEFFIPALQHLFFKPSPPQASRLLALTKFLSFENWGKCTRALTLKALADVLIKGDNTLVVDLGVLVCIYEVLCPGHYTVSQAVVDVERSELLNANMKVAQETAAMAARAGILQGIIRLLSSLDCDNEAIPTVFIVTSVIFPFVICGNIPKIAPDCIPALVDALRTATPRFWKGILKEFSEIQVITLIGLATLGGEVRAAAKRAGVIQNLEAFKRTLHGSYGWEYELCERALRFFAIESSDTTEAAIAVLGITKMGNSTFASMMALKPQTVDRLIEEIVDLQVRSEELPEFPHNLFPEATRAPAPATAHARRARPSLCQHCGKTAESDKKLKTCSGCSKVRYCSVECQKEDWKRHKNECRKV